MMDDEQTAAFLKGLSEAAKHTFWDHLGARVEAFTSGGVVVSLAIQQQHLNLIGIVHGGVYASLIDSAMGLVAMAAKPNDTVVTTNLNMSYLAPVEKGTLKVTAEIVHSTRRMITTQGYAYNEVGELCAMGTGTFRIMDRNKAQVHYPLQI
jgi:uncharacterized protein (TIGR00369 family)